jgi:2-polyprenyl-3-methyl-5-hydroxy-6-metoxy-1,4-benzoquinol methylase
MLDKDTNEKRIIDTQEYWDREAGQFDDEPDHGLRDMEVREAWTGLLKLGIPLTKAKVLDIGCGTGSLSVILAGLGHTVTGIDISPQMLAQAKAKVERLGYSIQFQRMDAAFPQFPKQSFDAILCRHLLWALPEPGRVLRRWSELIRPGGYLLLIEGFWSTGGGLHLEEVLMVLPESCKVISVQNLSENPDLWGGPVSDERYALSIQRND